MFDYDLIVDHLNENLICYEAYTQQGYSELLDKVKKLGAAKEKIRLQNHIKYITSEWNDFQKHFKRFDDITWRDLERESRRHYRYVEKEWEKIQNGTLNSAKKESSYSSSEEEDWNSYVNLFAT